MSNDARPLLAAITALVAAGTATLGCGATVHDFVHAKTGIEVGPDVRLCSNGVLQDDSVCRPNGTGGGTWVKNESFDVFPLPPSDTPRSWQEVMAWTTGRYLATPYWQGRLQPACKSSWNGGGATYAVDRINLAAKLDEQIGRRFAVEAVADLRRAGVPVDLEAEARFRDALRRLVNQKIRVQLLWFVATMTGGRYAIESNPQLHSCAREVSNHAGERAQFVTGVAGFVVLQNQADVSINSTTTIADALRVVMPDPTPVLSAKLEASWEKTVGSVVRISASTTSLTQTIYPLWVQFE